MLSRLSFVLIAAFWVTMNVLLWRWEFGGRNTGSPVPVEIVWQRMLTAPDNSSLEIFHHKQRIGFCRWAANVGEEQATGQVLPEGGPPEGMVKRLSSYRIDLEGNTALGDFGTRLRFDVEATFDLDHVWREFLIRLNLRPMMLEFGANAGEETLRIRTEGEDGSTERVIRFADLRNPEALLREFAPAFPLAMLGAAGLQGELPETKSISAGLKWEARHDWIRIGHSDVRVYRLETRLLDRYSIVILVSRVGEILRVQLPDEVVLINDQLTM